MTCKNLMREKENIPRKVVGDVNRARLPSRWNNRRGRFSREDKENDEQKEWSRNARRFQPLFDFNGSTNERRYSL